MSGESEPRFACDAMLGGLARWLRPAGYDATWDEHIDDWELIRLAMREKRLLLSSDSGIFRIGIVCDGEVPGLFIPHGMHKQEQLAFVLRELKLTPREPRCMACGGELLEAPKEEASGQVPERTLAWLERFYRCADCGQFFWQGTHWREIERVLRRMGEGRGVHSP